MKPTHGEDLVAALRSQLTSLLNRVEELERENERLVSQVSRCQCSAKKCQSTETMESAAIFSSNYSVASSNNIVEEEDKPVNVLCNKNSTKYKLRDGSGIHLRTIHHHAKRYIALKIMYFGQRFYGFASEAQMEPTIESEVFKALKRTMLLIGNKEDSHYSRCGRTDKGVSSTGQVISLFLRSNLKHTGEDNDTILKEKYEDEVDYVKVLNRVLPKDIRVIGWFPVPTDFHSRFSCLSREYRYLFWRGSLDILAMQKAGEKFVGEYDFRNFCKMDAANVSNYRRKITSFQISSCKQRSDADELWAMTIKGSAFLWHQIRCMVAVLFMIGQGLESPNVLDELLDTSKTSRKPQYNMASELPLVLRFCEFKNLNFICSADAKQALHQHMKTELQSYMLQAAIFHEALDCLLVPAAEESSNELSKKKKGHIPLMSRPTEPSYDERREKVKSKAAASLKEH